MCVCVVRFKMPSCKLCQENTVPPLDAERRRPQGEDRAACRAAVGCYLS